MVIFIALLDTFSGDKQGSSYKHLIGYLLVAERILIARNWKEVKSLNVQKWYNKAAPYREVFNM